MYTGIISDIISLAGCSADSTKERQRHGVAHTSTTVATITSSSPTWAIDALILAVQVAKRATSQRGSLDAPSAPNVRPLTPRTNRGKYQHIVKAETQGAPHCLTAFVLGVWHAWSQYVHCDSACCKRCHVETPYANQTEVQYMTRRSVLVQLRAATSSACQIPRYRPPSYSTTNSVWPYWGIGAACASLRHRGANHMFAMLPRRTVRIKPGS